MSISNSSHVLVAVRHYVEGVSAGSGLLDYRAIFNTRTAAGAQVHFYASRTFADFDLEISGFAFDRFQICICDQLDVQVPADLDQYGRDDSHCAVVGGKGFVQLGHDPADGG